MFEKVIRPTEIVRKFYVDDEFNAFIASPLKPDKKTWLMNSQVAYGMKLIKDKFSQYNILVRSPYIQYNSWSFCLDNIFVKNGNHIIKENTFFILNSKSHWVLFTNFGCEHCHCHLFDSLLNDSYLKSMSLIMNCISEIYKDKDFFFITHKDVQRQLGQCRHMSLRVDTCL